MALRLLLVGLLVMLAGCGENGRYVIATQNNALWRLDTRTGALQVCGFDQGKPVCTAFPDPKK